MLQKLRDTNSSIELGESKQISYRAFGYNWEKKLELG